MSEASTDYIIVHGRQNDTDIAYQFENIEAQKDGGSIISSVDSSAKNGRWMDIHYGSGQKIKVQFFTIITGTEAGNNIQGNDSIPEAPGEQSFRGDDTINGLGGADTLSGGTGDDVLYGGADVDAFHNDGGIDRIQDHQTDEHLYLNGVLINGQTLTGMTDRPGFYEDSQGYQYRWYHDNRLEIRDGRDDGFNLRATPNDLDLILLPAPDGVRRKSRRNNGRNARKNHNAKLDFPRRQVYGFSRDNAPVAQNKQWG